MPSSARLPEPRPGPERHRSPGLRLGLVPVDPHRHRAHLAEPAPHRSGPTEPGVVLERPIPEELLELHVGTLPHEAKLALIDRAMGRRTGPMRDMVEPAKSWLVAERDGRPEGALDVVQG